MDNRSYNPGSPLQMSSCRCRRELHPSMEVLRWFAVFIIAILLMVAGIFWLMGRPLPIPTF